MKKLLVLLLALTLLCGCSKAVDPGSSSSTSGKTSPATSSGVAKEDVIPFDETFKFSYLTSVWDPYSADENLISDMEKATNVKINIEYAPVDNYETRINTVIASNKIPDAIRLPLLTSVTSLIDQGAVIAIDELLEKYGQNIMSHVNEEDYPFLRNSSDGLMYMIPYMQDIPVAYSWYIRQDWMENLGLDTPKTWEDWLKVWRAFRDNDCNGNGNTKDEIPYTGQIYPFLRCFDIITSSDNYFCVTDDNKYTLVFEHPNYKSFLTSMANLYAEGILDPEFSTRVDAEMRTVMNADIGGSGYGWAEQAKLSTIALRDGGNADATWLCPEPIPGPGGAQSIPSRPKMYQYPTVITVGAEKSGNTEKIMQFWNWIYSDEGIRMTNYGVEGTHYNLKDNKPALIEPYNEGFVNYRGAGMNFQPISHLWTEEAYMQVLLTGKTYEDLDEPTKIFYDGLYAGEPYFKASVPTLVTDAYTKYSTDLLAKALELQANTVAGNISVDTFFSEYEKLKADGIQEVIDQAAEAWSKVK